MKPPKPIAAEKSQLQLFQARLDSQLKGKDRIRYEFGNKAAVVSTNNRNWIVNVEDLSDNPYDGHTLAVSISGAEKLTKNAVSEANVDKGCRGHDYKGDALNLIGSAAGFNLRKLLRLLDRGIFSHARIEFGWILAFSGRILEKIFSIFAFVRRSAPTILAHVC